jgi:hypothetical protein
MAFPQTPLPIKAEFMIGGVWTNVTSRIRLADMIRLRKGFQNEQGTTVTPDTAQFTVNNRDGLFSNRNPNSIYYGLLPKNTQCRFSVTGTTVNLLMPPAISPAVGGGVSTTDKAVLDIVGDLDIRVDVEPGLWQPGAYLILASKWEQTTNQRSWVFFISPSGQLMLEWTTDGTGATIHFVTATTTVPTTTARLSVKVTLDVDNGAAGNTVAFYYATSIGGAYTQIGTSVVSAGVTSIFSGSALVVAGGGQDITGTSVYGFIGKYYSMELRNGIAGTLVAKMDATGQAAGTTSWSDGLGTPNTWTVVSPAELTADDRRFWGEISELPQRWDPSGNDVYVPITASSILRRLGTGRSPLVSPIYRYFNSLAGSGYWPLETAGSSTVPGSPGALLIDVSFSTDQDFLGSAGLAILNSATSSASGTAKATIDASYADYVIYFKYPTVPAAETTLVTIRGTGTVPTWRLTVSNANFTLYALDKYGTTLNSQGTTFGTNVSPDNWIAMRFQIHTAGGSIYTEVGWYQLGDTVSWGFSTAAFVAGTSVGRFVSWAIEGVSGVANVGLQFAHSLIGQINFVNVGGSFADSANGFFNERAGRRFLRVAADAGIAAVVIGDADATVQMDRQPSASLVTILQECCDAESGFLLSTHTALGVAMRTRASLYAQLPGAVLDYGANALSGELLPTDDDQTTRNDVTITRPRGGFGRSIVTTGPNNTSSSTVDPQGVGLYDTSYQLNLGGDHDAVRSAEFATYLGTWDELRYPVVSVQLQRSLFVASATLTAAVPKISVGDPFSISNPPAWLPPNAVELMARGVVETLENRGWTFSWNTQPYGPFRNVNNLTSNSVVSHFRAAASNSSVQAGFTSTATSFTVQTPVGSKWGTLAAKPGNFPLDIFIAGERITVGAIAAAVGANQVFSSCTRSVNGIVKAHLVNEVVQIADVFYAGF